MISGVYFFFVAVDSVLYSGYYYLAHRNFQIPVFRLLRTMQSEEVSVVVDCDFEAVVLSLSPVR